MRKAQQKFDQSSRKCRQSLAKVSLKCRQTLAVSSAKTRPNLPQNFGQRSRQLGPNFWYFESSRRNTGATFFSHLARSGSARTVQQQEFDFPSASSLPQVPLPELIVQFPVCPHFSSPSSTSAFVQFPAYYPPPAPAPCLQFLLQIPTCSSLPPVPCLQFPPSSTLPSSSLPPALFLQFPASSPLPPAPFLQSAKQINTPDQPGLAT